MYIVRIFIFCYTTKNVCTMEKYIMSKTCFVNNGVRLGGILSPYPFCIYMDDLKQLNNVNGGCIIGSSLINNFDTC